jgi:hypothetical protein
MGILSRLFKCVLLLGAVAALLIAGSASARSLDPCGDTPGLEPCPVDMGMGGSSSSASTGSSAATQNATAPSAALVSLTAKLKAADLKVAQAKTSGTLKLSAALGHALKRTVAIKGSTKCYLGPAKASCASLFAKLKTSAKVTVDGPKSATTTIVASAITLAA